MKLVFRKLRVAVLLHFWMCTVFVSAQNRRYVDNNEMKKKKMKRIVDPA